MPLFPDNNYHEEEQNCEGENSATVGTTVIRLQLVSRISRLSLSRTARVDRPLVALMSVDLPYDLCLLRLGRLAL